MSKNIFRFMVLSFVTCMAASSCYYDNKEDLYANVDSSCDTSNVTFSNHITSIMSTSCSTTGCHDGITTAAGLNLSEYQGVKTAADNGTLVGRINGIGGNLMPLGGTSLPDCEILEIETWVSNGAPNN